MGEHSLVAIFASAFIGLLFINSALREKIKRLDLQLASEKRKVNRLRASAGYPGSVVFKQEERPMFADVGDLWIDRAGVTRRMIDEGGAIPGGEWSTVNAAGVKVESGSPKEKNTSRF